jgi:hypothetical protein
VKSVKVSKAKQEDNDNEAQNVQLDLNIDYAGEEEKTFQMENDTNMLIHTAGKNKQNNADDDSDAENKVEKKKKKLTRNEKIKLEKVLERKEKTSRRGELLEKLASIQIKSKELNMYSSVKNIGQKETKRDTARFNELNLLTGDLAEETAVKRSKINVNSIAGSNKKMKLSPNEKQKHEKDSELDTSDMSSDSEIDVESIHKAIEQHKMEQSLKNI